MTAGLWLSTSHGSPYWLHSFPGKMGLLYQAGGKTWADLGFYSHSFSVNPVGCSSTRDSITFFPFLAEHWCCSRLHMDTHTSIFLHEVHVTLENLTPLPFGVGVGQGLNWSKAVIIIPCQHFILDARLQALISQWPNWLIVGHLTLKSLIRVKASMFNFGSWIIVIK